jgi:probable F420-dependent oxidoreductase
MLAAWAEATTRIQFGPLVSCVSYRNPQLLADMARTVDRISGGRLILGLGAGWFERDYREYGYEFGTTATRLSAFSEALPTIRRRLDVLKPPAIRRLPVLIGGSGERRTLRLVAEHADSWHAGFPERPIELERKVEALEGWCATVGRDPAAIEWGVGVEPDDLERFLSEDADTYVRMGFRQFTLGFNGPAWAVDDGTAWLAWRDRQNSSAASRRGSETAIG